MLNFAQDEYESYVRYQESADKAWENGDFDACEKLQKMANVKYSAYEYAMGWKNAEEI